MKVEEMKVRDVIRTRQFKDCFVNVLARMRSIDRLIPGRQVSDRIDKKYRYDWDSLIEEYELILDKKSKLSAAERGFIISVGNRAFHKAVRELLDDEKKADAGNGDNKE